MRGLFLASGCRQSLPSLNIKKMARHNAPLQNAPLLSFPQSTSPPVTPASLGGGSTTLCRQLPVVDDIFYECLRMEAQRYPEAGCNYLLMLPGTLAVTVWKLSFIYNKGHSLKVLRTSCAPTFRLIYIRFTSVSVPPWKHAPSAWG
jgi:hypothetical protein